MTRLQGLKEGDRVILKGDHPWATHAGMVIGWETIELYRAEFPKVRLDEGQECFVFRAAQVRRTLS